MNALRLALASAIAASVAGAARESGTPKYSAAAIARGRYLAHAVCECFECHSPLYDDNRVLPIESKLGAGDILNKKTREVAANITPDPETGAGRWTERLFSLDGELSKENLASNKTNVRETYLRLSDHIYTPAVQLASYRADAYAAFVLGDEVEKL